MVPGILSSAFKSSPMPCTLSPSTIATPLSGSSSWGLFSGFCSAAVLEAVSLLDFFGGVALLDPKIGEVHIEKSKKRLLLKGAANFCYTYS